MPSGARIHSWCTSTTSLPCRLVRSNTWWFTVGLDAKSWQVCLPLICGFGLAAGHLYGATHITKFSGLSAVPQPSLPSGFAAAAPSACCSISVALRPTNESSGLTSRSVEAESLAAVEVHELLESVAEQQSLVSGRGQRQGQPVDVVVLVAQVDDQTAVAALLSCGIERQSEAMSWCPEHWEPFGAATASLDDSSWTCFSVNKFDWQRTCLFMFCLTGTDLLSNLLVNLS